MLNMVIEGNSMGILPKWPALFEQNQDITKVNSGKLKVKYVGEVRMCCVA